ncbi:MAG: hypothetical protein PHQ00_03760, partial [Phycisphaerae bacterium]|nr:hypothetical protein [Phycisphaerae bacterium]
AEKQEVLQQPGIAPSHESYHPYQSTAFDDFRDWFHNPTDWLSMGFDVRWRYIYGWNLDTLNDDATNRDSKWHFTRTRARWWTKTKLTDDMDFNLRLTWEFRTWDAPIRKGRDTDFDEIVFDTFNLTVRNLFDMPLTMVAGRQDIFLGAGWLICDPSPLDGSRTAYFDALRFTYQIPDRNTSVDLIYIENRAAADSYLKPINDRNKQLTEQDERAFILYVTDKSRENMQLEGYFILKNDNPINYDPSGPKDPWPKVWSKKARIYTFGGAISGTIGEEKHWKYRSEAAIQTGKKQTTAGRGMDNLMAYGTVNKLEYHFNDAKKNRIRGVVEYLSGDNPSSNKNEAFDPLWGEWPQIAETVSYAYNLETMIGEVTNLIRLGVGHSIQLTEKLAMDTDLNLLWADENTRQGARHGSGLGWSDGGHYRGTLATWWLKYNITKNLKGHLLFEYFQPGNYYISESRDPAYFTRVNLEYTF